MKPPLHVSNELLHGGGSQAPTAQRPLASLMRAVSKASQKCQEPPGLGLTCLAWRTPPPHHPAPLRPQRPQVLRGGGRHSPLSITGLPNRQLRHVVYGRAQDRVVCFVIFLNESRTHLEPARESGCSFLPRSQHRLVSRGRPETLALLDAWPRPAFRTPYLVVIYLHPENWGLRLLQRVHRS